MIQENFYKIQYELNTLRPENPPVLIAVSKTHSVEKIEEAIKAGIRVFGENKIKEGIEKFSKLKQVYPDLQLHHIGPVQTGTVKKLIGNFQFTHGVGSKNSLFELIKNANIKKTRIDYFLQVNLTLEDSKSGFEKDEIISLLEEIPSFNSKFALLHGLMTMGPSNGDLVLTRKVFSELYSLKKKYFPTAKLSMGMSGDYKIAIEEGADYIRVGSAIFGTRSII